MPHGFSSREVSTRHDQRCYSARQEAVIDGENMSQRQTNKPVDDLVVQEAKPRLKRPPLFKVFLLNDDFTPMEFVVDILKRFFGMDEERATQVMLHVHTRGVGVCGVYSRDIAETKVRQVNDFAREHQHPLLCDMEEA